MKKLAIKSWSVLGPILFAASAITAAMAPSKRKSDSKDYNHGGGRLVLSSNGAGSGLTCTQTVSVSVNQCHYTKTGDGCEGSSTSRDSIYSNPGSSTELGGPCATTNDTGTCTSNIENGGIA